MAITRVLLIFLFYFASIQWTYAMSTEELIFEKSPYIEAAKAIKQKDTVTLQKLISQGMDVNYEGKETKGPWGKDTLTLLIWAALLDNADATELLLRAEADPNKSTRRGMTALVLAPASKNESLYKLLLDNRANPNQIALIGVSKTPLMVVLQERRNLGEKRFERAEMLIKYGADVNLNLGDKDTALTTFGRLNDWRAVYWLLENGANFEIRDSVNTTMMCALRKSYIVNNLAPSEAFTYRDKVRDWLLAHGVKRSRVDPALHPSIKCDD